MFPVNVGTPVKSAPTGTTSTSNSTESAGSGSSTTALSTTPNSGTVPPVTRGLRLSGANWAGFTGASGTRGGLTASANAPVALGPTEVASM